MVPAHLNTPLTTARVGILFGVNGKNLVGEFCIHGLGEIDAPVLDESLNVVTEREYI